VGEQSAIANYARDMETALWTLQRQTGSNITIDEISLSVDDTTKINLKPLDFYLEKAFQNRPNLKIQDHLIRQAQLSEKKYRNSYVPSISLFAEASDIGAGETLFEPAANLNAANNAISASWTAGVQFTWSFDGLANVHAARKSDNQEIQYVLEKKDLELQVKQDVESAFNQVKNNSDLLKAAVAQYEQADATLQLKKKQFEVGTISRIDLKQAEQTYESTRFQLDSSKIDMRIAYQNLLFACGYPNDNHCI
jgi:outer membrane protein TolC